MSPTNSLQHGTEAASARQQHTRKRLLDAARDLFHQQGIAATSISQIIDASEHGRTTFYRYFRDLDDVLNQVVIRDFEQLIEDFTEQRFDHGDPVVQIVEDTCWFFRQMRVRAGLNILFTDRDRQLSKRISTSIEKFREVGRAYSRPTFEAASRLHLLRDGVTLERYVEWNTFVLVSMLSTPFGFTSNEFLLRDALRAFFVPSLIKIDCAVAIDCSEPPV